MRAVLLSLLLVAGVHAQTPAPLIPTEVLKRAGAYALDYEQKFALLVAEERYEQRAIKRGNAGGPPSRPNPGWDVGSEMKRVLKSDYLLVRLDGGGWMPFRAVFESTAARSAIARTVCASRFTFERDADDMVDGRAVWSFRYHETARPTLIKTAREQNLPLSGRLWIDADRGVIVKTHLIAADGGVSAAVTVTFRQDQELDFWVPAKMEESYHSRGTEDIVCVATYANYRRFKVATDEAIKKPPPM